MKKWLEILVRIVFYFVLGVALLYSPWIPLWTHNFFAAHYRWVGMACHNNYLRGAISGVGITDIWMAFDLVRRPGHSVGRGTVR
ncbi:MAG: hypothetical protein ACRD11_17400 [Terriglobia bacterium]